MTYINYVKLYSFVKLTFQFLFWLTHQCSWFSFKRLREFKIAAEKITCVQQTPSERNPLVIAGGS